MVTRRATLLSCLSPFLLPAGAGVLLLLAACAPPPYRKGREPVREASAPQGIPSWVLQPPLDAEYLYGVGTDLRGDRARALADGQRDIARQLHVTIRGTDQEPDELDTEQDAGASRPRVTIDHLELPGLTITREAATRHCLYLQVALNRAAWAADLRNRLAELDRDISAVLANHQQNPEVDPGTHPVGAAARLHQRLLPLVTKREEKLSHLLIAKPGTIHPAAPITLAEMRERLRQVLERVTVDIVASPDLEPILPQLTATCAGIGLRVTPGAAKPALRIRFTLTNGVSQVDGMERVEGHFLALIEQGDGVKLGSLDLLLRSSSLTETVAHDRLMRKIIGRWAEYVDQDFVVHLARL